MRSPNCRATITALEQAMLDAQGPVNGVQHCAAFAQNAPGSAWNPTPQARQKAGQFASVANDRRVATYAAQHAAPAKNKQYYRVKWSSSTEGRKECEAHAAALKMTLPQYREWLWADSPRPATPGAHSSHQAWAQKVLRQSA